MPNKCLLSHIEYNKLNYAADYPTSTPQCFHASAIPFKPEPVGTGGSHQRSSQISHVQTSLRLQALPKPAANTSKIMCLEPFILSN